MIHSSKKQTPKRVTIGKTGMKGGRWANVDGYKLRKEIDRLERFLKTLR